MTISPKQLNQLSAAFRVANAVCCQQLGETCGPGAIGLPTGCATPACARVVTLVSDSCGALVSSPSFPVGIGFKPLLDAAVTACAATADNRTIPHRYAVTASGAIAIIGAAASTGGEVTDGMGAGGRNSTTGLDTADVQAAPSRCWRYTWQIPATTSRPSSTICWRSGWWGDTLPAAGNRTYRSKVGGKVRVRAYSATGAESGLSTFFSFTIPCTGDVACGSHGSCDTANGTK